ncbi:hypothetical protein C8T65DRAFT_78722 [Cerioporus squamosus]|nr:hypothetical protein C8T65DRAFT_78722 [Cerioporus squamosus]
MANSDEDFADALEQVQLAFNVCRQSMSVSSLHVAMQTIDKFKRTVCEEVNKRALVNKLPHELLVDVFKQSLLGNDPCPTVVLDSRSRAGDNTRPLLWLTHVCHRWRSTALAFSILWRRIDCRNQDQLQEFALRSAPGPFSLFCDLRRFSSRTPDPLLSIASYADRLRRADIVYSNDTLYDPVHKRLLTLRCPTLECLTLSNSPVAASTGRNDPVSVAHTLICQVELPHLRALAIAPVANWLPADPLPALTHLYLSFRWRNEIRWPSILSILAHAPALEVLHLFHYQHKDPLEGEGEEEPIPLPHLKFIVLMKMSSLQRSLALLRQLAIPASCRICLDCHSNTPTLVADAVLPRFPATANSNRLTIVTMHSQLELVVEGPSSGFWLRANMSNAAPNGLPEGRFTGWLSQLSAMLPLSHLSSLQLRLHLPGTTITQILRETVCLTTLEVMFFFKSAAQDHSGSLSGADSLIHVCHALSQGPESQSILCPALHSLTIAMPCGGGSRPNIIDSHPFWLSAIRSLIRARTRIGRPIRRLAVQPLRSDCGALGTFHAPASVVDAVYAQYVSLGEEEDVEDFVLYDPGKEAIAFSTWDWGEIERYWALSEHDRPPKIFFCPRRKA